MTKGSPPNRARTQAPLECCSDKATQVDGMDESPGSSACSTCGGEDSIRSSTWSSLATCEDSAPKFFSEEKPLCINRVEELSRVFDFAKSGDADSLYRAYARLLSNDVELIWPDISLSVKGPQHVAWFWAKAVRCFPDLCLNLHDLAQDPVANVKLCFDASGTQSEQFLPMFPRGQHVQWQLHSRCEFDGSGKIRRNCVHFSFAAKLIAEPSAYEGLARCALALSSTPGGSRFLQDTLETAATTDKIALVRGLEGHAWALSASPHGNHVLQKLIVALPSKWCQFIIDDLRGRAVEAAQHQKRCRVLERLIEHCSCTQLQPIIEEIVSNASLLFRHGFANYIVQHVLEHGSEDQRHRMVLQICEQAGRLSRHKIASNVVRAALIHGSQEDKERLAETLAPTAVELASLSKHIVGSFVARELRIVMKLGNE